MGTRSVVILNQPVTEEAVEEVAGYMRDDSCRIHVVVPAIPPRDAFTYTEEEAHAVARLQLDRALRWFRERGLRAGGTVGDPSLFEATRDAIREEAFAQIILVTRPAGLSRWIKMDLPSRLQRAGIAATCLVRDAEGSEDRGVVADAGLGYARLGELRKDDRQTSSGIRTRRAS